MKLCIDASNIRTGGGVTHLTEMLAAADPVAAGFEKAFVWARRATLDRLPDRPWLEPCHDPVLERNFLRRALWQRSRLGKLTRGAGCNLLFVPGGNIVTPFHPVVTMSRNMLPFELDQVARFGLSGQTLRLLVLRVSQSRSVHRADGMIFLTDYARTRVLRVTGNVRARIATIPHGVDRRFFIPPRTPRALTDCSELRPFRLIYVSIIDMYKNQPVVAEAVARLRASGYPVTMEFIGPAYAPALVPFTRTLARLDPGGQALRYRGAVPYGDLHSAYADCDLVVFASSCENMPNILLEGMASGCPIASSECGPMPEVLGDGGAYFDPAQPASIAAAIRKLMESPELRRQLAARSFARAAEYSWTRCARDTFDFLATVART